jgi:pimeloyl-ACP methyl ester carboxylesterase
MWLDYEGLKPDDHRRIEAPTLIYSGDRDEKISLDLIVTLYRTLLHAELAICRNANHFTPVSPEGAGLFAATLREFAGRHVAVTS